MEDFDDDYKFCSYLYDNKYLAKIIYEKKNVYNYNFLQNLFNEKEEYKLKNLVYLKKKNNINLTLVEPEEFDAIFDFKYFYDKVLEETKLLGFSDGWDDTEGINYIYMSHLKDLIIIKESKKILKNESLSFFLNFLECYKKCIFEKILEGNDNENISKEMIGSIIYVIIMTDDDPKIIDAINEYNLFNPETTKELDILDDGLSFSRFFENLTKCNYKHKKNNIIKKILNDYFKTKPISYKISEIESLILSLTKDYIFHLKSEFFAIFFPYFDDNIKNYIVNLMDNEEEYYRNPNVFFIFDYDDINFVKPILMDGFHIENLLKYYFIYKYINTIKKASISFDLKTFDMELLKNKYKYLEEEFNEVLNLINFQRYKEKIFGEILGSIIKFNMQKGININYPNPFLRILFKKKYPIKNLKKYFFQEDIIHQNPNNFDIYFMTGF